MKNLTLRLAILAFILILPLNCLLAGQASLSCETYASNGFLNVYICNEGESNVLIIVDPRVIIFDITYKNVSDGSTKRLRSSSETKLPPVELFKYVCLPPANKKPVKFLKYTTLRIPIEDVKIDDENLAIVEFQLKLPATVCEQNDSFKKLFIDGIWATNVVSLRSKAKELPIKK